MGVNSFSIDPSLHAKLSASLSPARLSTYLTAVGGDADQAIRLHVWNTAISAAFYGPLQSLEVTLRNALDQQLAKMFGPAWMDAPACPLDAYGRWCIETAKRELSKAHADLAPSRIVAALSFGFWVSLLSPGGQLSWPSGPSAHYEMTLWRPVLRLAFPYASGSRKAVHRPINTLRTLRNRIAHHEPIFG